MRESVKMLSDNCQWHSRAHFFCICCFFRSRFQLCYYIMHQKFSELSNTFLDFTQIFYAFLKKTSLHKPYLGLSCSHFGTLKLKIGPFLRLWRPPEGEFLKWFWGKKYNCAADDRVTRQHFNWFPHNCTSLRKSEMKNLSIFIHGVLSYRASKITSCYLNTL